MRIILSVIRGSSRNLPEHEDFAKIRANMLTEYGAEKGDNVYHAWLNKCGFDDSKPMEGQSCKSAAETAVVVAEKFEWTMPFKYYDTGSGFIIRGEALHPGITKNKVLYTKEDLLRGARSLIGSRLEFLTHGNFMEPGNEVLDAEFVEPDRVEYVARVVAPRAVQAIKAGEITHVSPSLICRKAIRLDGGVKECAGTIFNGLCLVHRDDFAGPGDVRTTVSVWEKCNVERLGPAKNPVLEENLKMSEKKELVTTTEKVEPTPIPPSPTAATVSATPAEVKEQVVGTGPTAGIIEPSIEDRVKTLEERLENLGRRVDEQFATLFTRVDTLIQLQPAIAKQKAEGPSGEPAVIAEKEQSEVTVKETAPQPTVAAEKKPADTAVSEHAAAPSTLETKMPRVENSAVAVGEAITKPVSQILTVTQPGVIEVSEIRKVFGDPRLFTPQLREKEILRLIKEKEDDGHD